MPCPSAVREINSATFWLCLGRTCEKLIKSAIGRERERALDINCNDNDDDGVASDDVRNFKERESLGMYCNAFHGFFTVANSNLGGK